jgi:hypothetical protein
MSTHDIDDATAAQIDQRLGQAFDFLRDVIDDPDILENLPDGSQLAFRDEEIDGYHLRLTAACRVNTDREWTARVTGLAEIPEASPEPHLHLALDAVGTGETAEAAFDALVARIYGVREVVSEPRR